MAVKLCPLQETVPVSLQVCLTMSQKVLDTFDALEKKDLTNEKIALTVRKLHTFTNEYLIAIRSFLMFVQIHNFQDSRSKLKYSGPYLRLVELSRY